LTPWSKISQIDAGHFRPSDCLRFGQPLSPRRSQCYIYRTTTAARLEENHAGISDDAAVNAVREPQRPGLLFASTERAMWVSFDDGEHWHSLQLNLPYTSMAGFRHPWG